jgi:60 kDa SS-A/Ro ribonucleoprotein
MSTNKAMRGWGKGLRNAIGNWYTEKQPKDLAYQVVKYGQRDGWSHKDLLRLSHPKSDSKSTNDIFKYIINGWDGVGEAPHTDEALQLIWAVEKLKQNISENEIIALIEKHSIPMEAIPTEKRTAKVYESVLTHGAGITWVIRNLGNLSKQGLLLPGKYNTALTTVLDKLTSTEQLKKGRVHPLQMLVAYNTYKQGHGEKGSSTWTVQRDVVDALNDGFYKAFDAVEPSNKRFVLGLDVSGSMGCGVIAGMPGITPCVGTAVMSMVTKRTEPYCAVMGFADSFRDLGIGKQDSLEAATRKTVQYNFGSTDTSLPVQWALDNNLEVDCFVVYTDNETNSFGRPKTNELLDRYRQKTGIAARMVNVGMVPNYYTVADPTDKLSLNVVGFDTTAPAVISDFAAGKL